MFIYRGGGLFKKGCEASRFIKEGMTTITGSVGIDEVITDWLCGALRQADFLICALRDSTLCEEPTFDSLCTKKRHP
jgi:hypothetical protein